MIDDGLVEGEEGRTPEKTQIQNGMEELPRSILDIGVITLCAR